MLQKFISMLRELTKCDAFREKRDKLIRMDNGSGGAPSLMRSVALTHTPLRDFGLALFVFLLELALRQPLKRLARNGDPHVIPARPGSVIIVFLRRPLDPSGRR